MIHVVKVSFTLVLLLIIATVTLLNHTLPAARDVHYDKPKTILFWNSVFRRQDHYLGTGVEIFKNCEATCYATFNKSERPAEEFDAIIFHGAESFENAPKNRTGHQIYIYQNREPPSRKGGESFVNFYNWTMTYRHDSDVVFPYAHIIKKSTNYTPPSAETISKRRKKIAWIVSHCSTSSQRHKIVDYVKKFIPVDVFGKCGRKCDNCYENLEKHYKFYLSFENSICEDYVTEKLYNMLKKNIIPVVYGGGNYSGVSPPFSVINVDDFENLEGLVRHLKFLDANPEEYLKYFEWKKEYLIDRSYRITKCELCKKLHDNRGSKSYKDVSEWWKGGMKMTKCDTSKTSLILKKSL